MHIQRHPIRRRPIGLLIMARRSEKAAMAARSRAYAAIETALAHYTRNPLPVGTGADWPGCWELLGDYAGAAAAMDRSPPS